MPGKEPMTMEDDRIEKSVVCTSCACSQAQAMANARALNFETECRDRIYSCCQLAEWTKEQWLVWLKAAREEQQTEKEVKRPAESGDSEKQFLPVRMRKPNEGRKQ